MNNNPEQQQGESQLLGNMKKNTEEEEDDESSNNFSSNFHSLNPESFNANNNIENNSGKNIQEVEPNYDEFLNSPSGEKLISSFAKLNLGNPGAGGNGLSPKKNEGNNYFQNPMSNMNNKSNPKDLAFNYYFGEGFHNDSLSKRVNEQSNKVPSTQEIMEQLMLNSNQEREMKNPQKLGADFNLQQNELSQGQIPGQNSQYLLNEKEERNIIDDNYPLNTNSNNINNIINEDINNPIQMNKGIMNQLRDNNINFNNNINNLNHPNQKIDLMNMGNNNNFMMGNLPSNNNNNNNNQMIQANNTIGMPYNNNLQQRLRNMIQQNMMNNMMMGNQNMPSINQNQNQNQMIINQQNQNMLNNNQNNISNQKNKKKKVKNNNNNNKVNNNNVNIQNMNLIMNQQQPQMINYQNFNQFMGNQNKQANNMINYPTNQNQLNFNNRGFIPPQMNTNNLPNNFGNIQASKFINRLPNRGYMPNMPMMAGNNNNMISYTLEQIINNSNSSFPGKFYVIKSIDESNILSSIRFKIWCSTIKGNQKLQKAYKEADKKYPIILFFSVNGSGKFMGIAIMNSDVEYKVNFNYWSQNDKWKGFFLVDWICIKDVPNRMFRTIINDLNENKPVTSSRDTQEICTPAGIKMLKVFKDYPQESTIFDSQIEENNFIPQQMERSNIPNFGIKPNINMNNINLNNMNLNNINMNNINKDMINLMQGTSNMPPKNIELNYSNIEKGLNMNRININPSNNINNSNIQVNQINLNNNNNINEQYDFGNVLYGKTENDNLDNENDNEENINDNENNYNGEDNKDEK